MRPSVFHGGNQGLQPCSPLQELRGHDTSADAEITILISTGLHRETTREELESKFGPEITEHETIIVHDCDDTDNMVYLGKLPSGGNMYINRLAVEADLLVAEGFIEPHFFAGFSGGRKSVLPRTQTPIKSLLLQK